MLKIENVEFKNFPVDQQVNIIHKAIMSDDDIEFFFYELKCGVEVKKSIYKAQCNNQSRDGSIVRMFEAMDLSDVEKQELAECAITAIISNKFLSSARYRYDMLSKYLSSDKQAKFSAVLEDREHQSSLRKSVLGI